MKPSLFGVAVAFTALCQCASAQSLMDVQEKQKSTYGKCESLSSQLLGGRDLDGDEVDEMIQMYSFSECAGKNKAGTAVVVFYKAAGKWKASKGDTTLSPQAGMYSLEPPAQGDAKDVIVLKNVFEDDAPPIRIKYSKGTLKRQK